MHSEMFCVRFSVLPVLLRSLSLVLLHVRSIYLIPSLSLRHFVSRSRPLFSLLSHSFGYQTTYASVGRRFVTTLFNVHNKLSAPHSVNVLVHIACEQASERASVSVYVVRHTYSVYMMMWMLQKSEKIPTHNRPIYHDATALTYMIIVYTDGLPSGSRVCFDPLRCVQYIEVCCCRFFFIFCYVYKHKRKHISTHSFTLVSTSQ